MHAISKQHYYIFIIMDHCVVSEPKLVLICYAEDLKTWSSWSSMGKGKREFYNRSLW